MESTDILYQAGLVASARANIYNILSSNAGLFEWIPFYCCNEKCLLVWEAL